MPTLDGIKHSLDRIAMRGSVCTWIGMNPLDWNAFTASLPSLIPDGAYKPGTDKRRARVHGVPVKVDNAIPPTLIDYHTEPRAKPNAP